VKGPPITITCECGESRQVPYGETWACETCGRRWDTGQIPAAEYAGLMRSLRRYKIELLALTGGTVAVFLPLIVFVSGSYLFLAAIAAFALLFVYLPFWRQRIRRAARAAPRWQLSPE